MARADLLRPTAAPDREDTGDFVKLMCEPALRIRALSAELHGDARAVEMIGQSPAFLSAMT